MGSPPHAKHVKSTTDVSIPLDPDAYKNTRVAVWIMNEQNPYDGQFTYIGEETTWKTHTPIFAQPEEKENY